ncbi:MAG: hypothetical protein JNJ61_19070 [Anaerolineae bacterium]|nr:hypothetical protein [Anaerolineae bacterium]
MSALHDETRSRWSRLNPEKFIGSVLYGALREKIKLTYTVVSVYTQIIHSVPGTGSIRLQQHGNAKEPTSLRDLLKNMRACMADAHDVIQCDTPTLSLPSYTPEGYILFTVRDLQHSMQPVVRWGEMIANDPGMSVEVPTLDGKTAAEVGAEIIRHVAEVSAILEFAERYAEHILHSPTAR